MFVLNGKVLRPGQPFNHKGLQYPGDWLGQSTPAQRSKIGIVSRQTPKKLQTGFDTRFWFAVGEPRDLQQVRDSLLDEQNSRLSRLLSATDWMYVRQAETGEPVPASTADYRKECRDVHATNENLISAAESVEELEILHKSGLEAYPSAV